MSFRARAISLLAAATLAACIPTDPIGGGNRFAGCYDRSCVDVPQTVPGVPPLTSITTMTSHACGLTATGEAWCWGDNSSGQLGDGTDAPRNAPVRVAGNLRFSSIAAGGGFTCAIDLSSVAYCWGAGALGQQGPETCGINGSAPCARSPLRVGSRLVTVVAAGLRHACVVDTDGAAWCWGFNFLGEAGSTAYGENVPLPRRVSGSNVFAAIEAGESFTCALTTQGQAWCWGAGSRGELGRPVPICNSVAGFANYCSAVPVPVNTSATFTRLSSGHSHSCALTAAGTAHCWGDNGQAQLGTTTFDRPVAPVVAQGGTSFQAIGASGGATCATPTSGPSVCWGLNLFGKLGIGTRQDLSPTPLPMAGGRRFTAFAGGEHHFCALTADGIAWCWGSGRNGQLGTGPLAP
jgi:alpha-tubulin suppressor-like RCC1 family protein